MTHYETLGVTPSADEAEIRAAYLRLARRHHPDARTSAAGDADDERMRDLNEAWTVLRDASRRSAYDRSIGIGAGAAKPKREWQPPADDGFDPLDEIDPRDLVDDVPYGRGSELPAWVQVMPASLIALAVLFFAIGMVTGLAALLALSVTALVLGLLAFLAAPMMAVFRGRRAERGS